MSGYISGRTGLLHRFVHFIHAAAVGLAVIAFFLGTAAAFAQSVGPDEAVNADGAETRKLGLTDAQKTAIYNAVVQQHVRRSPGIPLTVPVAVGAPVSPATELTELPVQAAVVDPLATDLKYAMVEDNVVVVDPIKMRVVEVIHRHAGP